MTDNVALLELLKESNAKKIHTAVETCGWCDIEDFKKSIDFIDLFHSIFQQFFANFCSKFLVWLPNHALCSFIRFIIHKDLLHQKQLPQTTPASNGLPIKLEFSLKIRRTRLCPNEMDESTSGYLPEEILLPIPPSAS